MNKTTFEDIRCLVIGYGSIGRRHTEILGSIGINVTVLTSQKKIGYSHINKLDEIDNLNQAFDYIIISNGTNDHYTTLDRLIKKQYQGRILIEKPLFDQSKAITSESNNNIFVGYNLRFHPALLALKKKLMTQKILSTQIYCGSYLPDWRPDKDYRTVDSSSDISSGGVVRELSHELDYAQWLLGDFDDVTVLHGHVSSLEMLADDLLVMQGQTTYCPAVSIQMNYFDRIGHREIRVNCDHVTFIADLMKNTLQENNEVTYYDIERNHSYATMHKAILAEDNINLCTLKEGSKIMTLIDRIVKVPKIKQ